MVRILRDLVDSLPTAQEKREAADSLATLTRFLQDLAAQLHSIPASDESHYLVAAIDRLDSLFRKAQSDPVLARAVGLEPPKRRPAKTHPQPDAKRIESSLAELRDLTIDQIRERSTSEDRYGLSDLRALASHMGVAVKSRSTRQTLANQIVTKLANIRGYRGLSAATGEDHE
jgi:hypothetical protein